MNEYVESKVGPPGIALAIFGLLCLLFNLAVVAIQGMSAVASILLLVEAGAGAEQWITWFLSTGIYLTMSLFSMLWSVVMILAGLRLRSGRSAALVYVGAVMAMLPCCAGYCCCFGLPLGIWAIVTMQDEQVKVAFAEG